MEYSKERRRRRRRGGARSMVVVCGVVVAAALLVLAATIPSVVEAAAAAEEEEEADVTTTTSQIDWRAWARWLYCFPDRVFKRSCLYNVVCCDFAWSIVHPHLPPAGRELTSSIASDNGRV